MISIQSFNKLPQCALDIRITVFVTEQGFVDEIDEIDSIATHFVAFDGDKAIATCRIFDNEDGGCILGRLAVLKNYRGKGIGQMLLDYVCDYAKENAVSCIRLHSQYTAREFYKKCGFSECSQIDYEQGCKHIWMNKIIK